MKLSRIIQALTVPALALVVGSACGSSSEETPSAPGSTYDFTLVLDHSVDNVIVPTYRDLATGAGGLHTATQTLQAQPTDANLEAAREAWIAARVPWEQSEAFLFGPVADLALDPALDSWPVDRVQLDQVLASNLELTADAISGNFGGGLKGFHTIEYLLWGANHNKTAAELAAAPRELEYLVAAADALMLDAQALHDAWAPPEDAFGDEFKLSGQEGGRYFSQADAVQQLVNGMVDICDEVANGKIADPFDEQNPTLVESQFSYNSIQDFTDNIRSIQNVYTGEYAGSTGPSVSTFVAEQDPALDARVRAEIQAAIDAIYASVAEGQPFRDAITDPAQKAKIEAAQEAIRTLMETFQGPVMSLVVS